MRVLLILVDGMRPDALPKTPNAKKILERCTYVFEAQTVMPSVTLPCHMSLFHSVDPLRHGTTTNTYAPQVRPVRGLCEVLAANDKKCAFFYNWEELRDLTRPGTLVFSCFSSGEKLGYDRANGIVSRAAAEYLTNNYIDFAFLYLGYTDMAGHRYGWMSDEYIKAMDDSFESIGQVLAALPDDYTVIVTADHGGHGRMHGTDLPEDMTIPIMILGKNLETGKTVKDPRIKDIAPTVAKLLGTAPDGEWEGRSLL